MHITKSDYLLFKQCPKSLWLQKNNASIIQNSNNHSRIDKGNEVTELARGLFPNGTLVPYSKNVLEMVERTKDLLSQGETTLYEAAFEHNSMFVICDILHRNEAGWNIYEVKSSTQIKERHLDDITYQLYVIQQNINLSLVYLVHLNNKYSRNGELDLKELFTFENQTENISKKLSFVASDTIHMKALIKDDCVKQDIGIYCDKYGKDDFPCNAKDHCWAHIPDHSVFDITRIGKKAFELYNESIISIGDISDEYQLSDSQRSQVQAYRGNIQIVEKEQINEFMSSFTLPLYFLDFETFQQTIPLFNDVKPYQQIPFQYSIHILKLIGSEPIHREFLAKEGTDPRRTIAERLVEDIPRGVCSVAYNMSFERMVLKALIYQFPDLADHLMDIHDNMVDLMVPFQKKWYYTNDMRGSYSIKYVLPALLPGDKTLDYTQLNIKDGSMAMEIYEYLHTRSPEEIKVIREELLAYCKLDTYAMLKIWERLISI